ncbi:vitamin B12-dependent ribonucleotide reductase [Candidatus Saccharibacteria bacterium]|nr:vitamin B12-dependent ribonucleotide reductase [Candidatus Saccharibacteria bacterium]
MAKKQTTELTIKRHFTDPKRDAYDLVVWQNAAAQILNHQTGAAVFEQNDLEFPADWSQNAINIVAQKYFSGELGSKRREYSLKQLIDRVVNTIARHGHANGYFESTEEVQTFVEELKYVLATQRAAFNSPVWFNIGVEGRSQQASACFILSIEDSMPSILNWYKEEGMIFKGGSGSGVNLSPLRSSVEGLSGSAGKASGPVSFMRAADSSAGTIQSGGKTRRAAKMVILNVDHPDVEAFVWCKAKEERKAQALADAGFDMSIDGEDIYNVQYQNANNSVRVSDAFMRAVENDEDWHLQAAASSAEGRVLKTVRARDLFRQISQAAWECADPGLQFDDTINDWHTTPNVGRINASNPCSEYMHIDDSACNLASLNLLKFLDENGKFKIDDFTHTVELVTLAQEILVGYSDYPTSRITKNAKDYRQLGLGYANLGAFLMSQGLPYDSSAGRSQAAAVTALMTGQAYATSAKAAQKVGPFAGYKKDEAGTLRVIEKHRQAVNGIDASEVYEGLLTAAASAWDEALRLAKLYGVRNAQASVLAPTGTIGLMMDCDTTGIEPDLGLVKFKNLVGGGQMKFVNQTVRRGLVSLGYTPEEVKAIIDHIEEKHSIVGAPHFNDDHLEVFACSIGDNTIDVLGHVKMMEAVQPFLSGAISKTVNMPEESTIEDVENIYTEAWKRGLKAIAIYRDNCKVAQPVSVSSEDKQAKDLPEFNPQEVGGGFVVKGAVKRSLPAVRTSKTFEFKLADSKGFMTVGEFEDGTPGEIFIVVSKQGSTLAGVMDALAISVSHGLQHGVPLKSYVKAFINMSFAPSGLTNDPQVRTATSFVDYIFRRIAKVYLSYEDLVDLGVVSFSDQLAKEAEMQTKLLDEPAEKTGAAEEPPTPPAPATEPPPLIVPNPVSDLSSPMCLACGNPTQRAGACYVCRTCGLSTGCS